MDARPWAVPIVVWLGGGRYDTWQIPVWPVGVVQKKRRRLSAIWHHTRMWLPKHGVYCLCMLPVAPSSRAGRLLHRAPPPAALAALPACSAPGERLQAKLQSGDKAGMSEGVTGLKNGPARTGVRELTYRLVFIASGTQARLRVDWGGGVQVYLPGAICNVPSRPGRLAVAVVKDGMAACDASGGQGAQMCVVHTTAAAPCEHRPGPQAKGAVQLGPHPPPIGLPACQTSCLCRMHTHTHLPTPASPPAGPGPEERHDQHPR